MSDSNTFENIVGNINNGNFIENPYNRSYDQTAWFYAILHINSRLIAGVVSVTLIAITSLLIHFLYVKRSKNIAILCINCAFIMVGSIFMSGYSKEFIVLFLITLPYIIILRKSSIIANIYLITFLIGFTIFKFREYFILIAFLIICVYITLSFVKKSKIRDSLLMVFLISYIIFPLIITVMRFYSSPYSLLSSKLWSQENNGLMMSPGSAIYIPFQEITLPNEIMSTFVASIVLLFPFTLIAKISIYYILIFVIFSAFFGYYIYNLKRYGQDLLKNSTAISAFTYITAFLCVSCLFEPDYGSFLRHMTVILPIFVVFYGVRRHEE